jgi:pimeloyl-ACP methyl ester carboxylesterase
MKVLLRALLVLLLLAGVGGLILYLNPLWVADQQIRLRLWQEGVKSEYVDAGGYRLHYFEAQPVNGGGAPLLLIHGLGARGEDWSMMIPPLAANGFHVYAPDLPGYGRSSRPRDADYSITMEEAAMAAFAKALHLTHTSVGGWSMGGWIAMKLTLDHPQMVDRLVVYDSAGVYFPANFGAELFVPGDAPGITRLMKMLSPHPQPLPGFVARDILRKFARNGWVIERSMGAMTGGRDLLDFRLQDIHQPTLVVWGAEDGLIPLAVGRRIHELIPNSALRIVEGCGHLAPLECWKPVAATTEAFLHAQPAIEGGEQVLATHYSSSAPH